MLPFPKPEPEIFSQPGIGLAERTITPTKLGRIKFDATHWFARFYDADCRDTVVPDSPVQVIGRQGNTLLVIPYKQANKLLGNVAVNFAE